MVSLQDTLSSHAVSRTSCYSTIYCRILWYFFLPNPRLCLVGYSKLTSVCMYVSDLLPCNWSMFLLNSVLITNDYICVRGVPPSSVPDLDYHAQDAFSFCHKLSILKMVVFLTSDILSLVEKLSLTNECPVLCQIFLLLFSQGPYIWFASRYHFN